MSKLTDFLFTQQEIAHNIIWASEAILLNMHHWNAYVTASPENEKAARDNMLGHIANHCHGHWNPHLMIDFITDWKAKVLDPNQLGEDIPIGSNKNEHNIITPDGASYEKRPKA